MAPAAAAAACPTQPSAGAWVSCSRDRTPPRGSAAATSAGARGGRRLAAARRARRRRVERRGRRRRGCCYSHAATREARGRRARARSRPGGGRARGDARVRLRARARGGGVHRVERARRWRSRAASDRFGDDATRQKEARVEKSRGSRARSNGATTAASRGRSASFARGRAAGEPRRRSRNARRSEGAACARRASGLATHAPRAEGRLLVFAKSLREYFFSRLVIGCDGGIFFGFEALTPQGAKWIRTRKTVVCLFTLATTRVISVRITIFFYRGLVGRPNTKKSEVT